MMWPETVVPIKPPTSWLLPPWPGLSMAMSAQPMPANEDCSNQLRELPG